MDTNTTELIAHPAGEPSLVEELSATADTFGGRVHVEWDPTAPVTLLGQLPFFIDYLKQGGLFVPGLPIARCGCAARTRRASGICLGRCCCRRCPAIAATPT